MNVMRNFKYKVVNRNMRYVGFFKVCSFILRFVLCDFFVFFLNLNCVVVNKFININLVKV